MQNLHLSVDELFISDLGFVSSQYNPLAIHLFLNSKYEYAFCPRKSSFLDNHISYFIYYISRV